MKAAIMASVSLLAALAAMPAISLAAPSSAHVSAAAKHQRRIAVFVVSINGTTMTVRKRNGKQLDVDIAPALADNTAGLLDIPNPGPVILSGWRGPDKVFHVSGVSHSNRDINTDGQDDDPK